MNHVLKDGIAYACFSIYSEKLINRPRIPFRNKMAETSKTRRTAVLSTPTDLKISGYSNFFSLCKLRRENETN